MLVPGAKPACLSVLLRFVGHHGDALDAFVAHLPGNLRHGELPVNRLPAGHGHRIVEQDLVGDVDACRDRGADSENPGVVIGAVAELLEDVGRAHEGSLTDPGHPLAAHLAVGVDLPVHPVGHEVAADAAVGAAALRHPGGSVVRATGAEIGQPGDRCGFALAFSGGLPVQEGEARAQPFAVVEGANAPGQRTGDLVRVQVADVIDQLGAAFVQAGPRCWAGALPAMRSRHGGWRSRSARACLR